MQVTEEAPPALHMAKHRASMPPLNTPTTTTALHAQVHMATTAKMAPSTAQTLPGQERPKPAPVDTLQSMMNMLLIQSGRFVREYQSGGGTGRQRQQLRSIVPVASERFQDALDELQNEVRLAQTVLRRDLALLKQDRKKREMAAKEKEAEKARLAAEPKKLGTAPKPEEIKVETVSTPAQPEAPVEDEKKKESEKQPEPKKELHGHEEIVFPPPINTTITDATERDPLFDGTPTTANPQENEFDFDAMFGDAMDTSGDNNQNDIMDTSGDLGFDFDNLGNDNDNDEGPSLLRGLEDLSKSGNDDNAAQTPSNMDMDITMGDLPDLNTTTEPSAPAEQPALPASPPKPAEAPAPQPLTEPTNAATTNNNDAPNNDTATDDMMGGMVTDNLDDLFNMDEYENPENSSFDDAFFNFDN